MSTSQAGWTVLSGINLSLASPEDWMISGDEVFLDEREVAWKTKIKN